MRRENDEASQRRMGLIEEEIARLRREYADLEEIWKAEKAAAQGSAHLKEEIDKMRFQIEELKRKGDFNTVAELQYGKLPDLEKTPGGGAGRARPARPTAGGGNRSCCARRSAPRRSPRSSRAPPASRSAKLMQGERDKLLQMEDKLHERVVGQDEAIKAVVRRDPPLARGPVATRTGRLGSFLFLGPTGVGKTELCKALAGFLFDSEDHLIRVDMSEFMEKHSVSRLIGAPPGYVGYDEGGTLTEAVRRKPYSVLLLDEVEKAHPDVFNVLLQVLDDGRLTDGQGRTVDFKNTVIVMTSNLGSHHDHADGGPSRRRRSATRCGTRSRSTSGPSS